MYRHISDFLTDWGHESASTIKLLKNLSDESLTKKVHPKVRTLGFLAWHLIHTLHEMPLRTGLTVDIPSHPDYAGETVKQLLETYEKGANMLAEAIKKNWTDADLNKEQMNLGRMMETLRQVLQCGIRMWHQQMSTSMMYGLLHIPQSIQQIYSWRICRIQMW